jgi:hypothetical protein
MKANRRHFLSTCAAAGIVGRSSARGEAQSVEQQMWPSTFPALRQRVNDHPLSFLDSAATTLRPQSLIDALVEYYSTDNANPSRADDPHFRTCHWPSCRRPQRSRVHVCSGRCCAHRSRPRIGRSWDCSQGRRYGRSPAAEAVWRARGGASVSICVLHAQRHRPAGRRPS